MTPDSEKTIHLTRQYMDARARLDEAQSAVDTALMMLNWSRREDIEAALVAYLEKAQ